MTTTHTTLNNVPLDELYKELLAEQDRKVDVVVAREAIDIEGGQLQILAGPTTPAMTVDITDQLLQGIVRRTSVGAPQVGLALARDIFARATRELKAPTPPPDGPTDEWWANEFVPFSEAETERADFRLAFDALFGAKLAHDTSPRFLLRTFRPTDPTAPHTGRALLGQNHKRIDHIDVTTSVLAGVRDAGLFTPDVRVNGSLTPKGMRLLIELPQITYLATEFLKTYKSPFRRGRESSPLVSAGLEVRNSETGGGACVITPRFVVQACDNGLLLTKDLMRSIHLGAGLEEGEVTWSQETQDVALQLVKAKVRDAVAKFLDPEYLETKMHELEGKAATPVVEPVQAIELVSSKQAWSQEETDSIMNLFINSGQITAGGVMQAITAHAQRVPDPDRAYELEAMAIAAMELVAA